MQPIYGASLHTVFQPTTKLPKLDFSLPSGEGFPHRFAYKNPTEGLMLVYHFDRYGVYFEYVSYLNYRTSHQRTTFWTWAGTDARIHTSKHYKNQLECIAFYYIEVAPKDQPKLFEAKATYPELFI